MAGLTLAVQESGPFLGGHWRYAFIMRHLGLMMENLARQS